MTPLGGGSIRGIAAGNGAFVFQSSTGVMAISPSSNAVLWNVKAPQYFNDPGNPSYPSIGGGTVYTLWSSPSGYNSEILAQNLSSGNVLWTAKTPYTISAGEIPIAYGKLYLSAKVSTSPTRYGIVAFGGCPVNSNSSILASAAMLYLNGQGGCANYLLNSVSPMYNYTLFINNLLAPSNLGPVFNGDTQNSYVEIPPLNALNGQTSYTISAWLKYNGGSSSFSQFPYPVGWPGCHMGFMYAPGNYLYYMSWITTTQSPTSGCGGTSGSYTNNTIGTQVQQGKWYNAVATINIQTETTSVYINGAFVGSNVLPTNYYYFNYSENGYFGDYLDGNTGSVFFNGMIANVQIYNSSLSSSDVAHLYLGGVSGLPVQNSGLVAWYPLAGDANDYSGSFNTGFPLNVNWGSMNFTPQGLGSAFEISRSSSVLGLENFTTGISKLYNVSVVTWR